MLRIHRCEGDRLVAHSIVPTDDGPAPPPGNGAVWLDLFNPTPEEDAYVERTLGISLPSREEMQEIEVSARLYNEGGAEFMTITAHRHARQRRPGDHADHLRAQGRQPGHRALCRAAGRSPASWRGRSGRPRWPAPPESRSC